MQRPLLLLLQGGALFMLLLLRGHPRTMSMQLLQRQGAPHTTFMWRQACMRACVAQSGLCLSTWPATLSHRT